MYTIITFDEKKTNELEDIYLMNLNHKITHEIMQRIVNCKEISGKETMI